MVITKPVGHIDKWNNGSKKRQDLIELDWEELNKRILRKKTSDGRDVAISLEKGVQLQPGDILFEDAETQIIVNTVLEDVFVLQPTSIEEMGKAAFELGNRHTPCLIENGEIVVRYDATLPALFKETGVSLPKKKDAFINHLSIKDTTITMKTNQLHLMQIHDSAFPIGSYTHSFGMESYIQDGYIYNQETLKQYCLSYLFDNLTYGDGLIVKETMEAVSTNRCEKLPVISSLCHAIKIAKESRNGSLQMGQQFLKTIRTMDKKGPGGFIEQELKNQNLSFHYPIIYRMYTSLTDMKILDAIAAFLYSSTTAMVHNAVRAVPLGQTTGV
ncbi:urease accessory UreF family protein [Alteribacillus sp. JSM 102045]|uniref:urease accessory UreF family protein n=1 Tax=Alteribacillus sp. JSM 102045 TaxID=1562101 RepID=UPI0035C17A99